MKPLLILFGLGAAAMWLLAGDKAATKPADKPAEPSAPTGGAAPPVDLLALYAVDTAAKSPAFAKFAAEKPTAASAIVDVAEGAGLPVMWLLAGSSSKAAESAAELLAISHGSNNSDYFTERSNIAPLVAAAVDAVQKCMATCGHQAGSEACRTACITAIEPAFIAACAAQQAK